MVLAHGHRVEYAPRRFPLLVGRVRAEPVQVGLNLRQRCGGMRSGVIMPTTVAFRHSGIIESSVDPLMRLGVPIRKGKYGRLPVLVSGEVIHLGRVHVDPKLRTTNAVRMEFAENKDVG